MRALLLGLVPLAAGCLTSAEPPFLGTCADYPGGIYDYGEIGIGTCIATPTDLAFVERGDRTFLVVSNANAFRDFSGGSVLFVDWASLDLDADRNLTGDLVARAVELPPFAGTLALVPERELLAVPVRYSEGATTREQSDLLYFIDVSDPISAALAGVAADGEPGLAVGADPFATRYDPSTGRLYVGNRTDHTIAVVDVLADPVALVDTTGGAAVRAGRWFAEDAAAHASFSVLEVLDADALVDEQWEMVWVEGTWRLWLPEDGGLRRVQSGGDGAWTTSSFGVELAPDEYDLEDVTDPFPQLESADVSRLLFADAGTIRVANPDTFLAEWVLDEDPLLEGRAGEWDASLGGPAVVDDEGYSWLFYDGTGSDGVPAIGLARSISGEGTFSRVSTDPVLAAGGAHDAAGQADPVVLWDEAAAAWRMWYSAFDGESWTIGHAWSDDLATWTADDQPVVEVPGGHAAAPEVVGTRSGFTMFYSRFEGDTWTVGEATSVDGTDWVDVDAGVGADLGDDPATPPGVGLSVDLLSAFRVDGDHVDPLTVHVAPGETLESLTWGFRVRVVAGQLAELDDAGDGASNGLGVGSVVDGRAWFEQVDATGTRTIGAGTWDGEALDVAGGTVLEPGTGFDAEGVGSPVVVGLDGGGYVMFYAGHGSTGVQVGRATSPDGETWTRDADPVLSPAADWEAFGVVPGSVEVLADGTLRLWYAGTDGERYRIAAATSVDGGETFARLVEDDWLFGTGAPGAWDDSSVRDPWVEADDGVLHLWYTGNDGVVDRIGHATSTDDGLTWSRDLAEDGSEEPLLEPTEGTFDYSGVARPVVVPAGDGERTVFYQGQDGAVFRPGLVRAPEATAFYKDLRMPGPGDRLEFVTLAGGEGVEPMDLDTTVEELTVTGQGLTGLFFDEDRGFLYVGSKLTSYILVMDVRDDSVPGFDDLNYLGVEALLTSDVAAGGAGFRAMSVAPGTSFLYALNDSPEAVFVYDLDHVVDDGVADVVRNAQVGWLPAARGDERDEGVATQMTVGPAALELLPGGDHLLVANFNDNSVTGYDLRLGPWGMEVGRAEFLGENPAVVRVTPDGRYAVVALYEGDVGGEPARVQSTLAVVGADPTQDDWLEVVTWIANR